MAKLSAHGRTELLRLAMSSPAETPYEGLVWVIYAFLSDGWVLCKVKHTDPANHTTWASGWKRWRRLKKELLPTLRETATVRALLQKGFKEQPR